MPVSTVATTAGLDPQDKHTKNPFASEPKGLRQIRDHVRKAFGEQNSDLTGIFLCGPFLLLFQNDFQNNAQTKLVTADLDSSRRILLCRGLRSFCLLRRLGSMVVVVVNLASRPPQFLGCASSDSEGLGSHKCVCV